MAETTGIAWCGLGAARAQSTMLYTVASATQRQSIRRLKTKIGMRRKWFDVVSVEITSARVAAMSAPEGIAREDIKAPSLVLVCVSEAHALGVLAVFVCGASGASWRALPRHLADKHPGFKAVLGANPMWRRFAKLCGAHGRLRGRRVRSPLEIADAALRHLPNLHLGARATNRREAIEPRSISVVVAGQAPSAADPTELLPGSRPGKKFINRNAGSFSGEFAGARGGLRHG